MGKRKRIIIIGIATLLVISAGGILTYRLLKASSDKAFEQKKESVQAALQQENDSCSQDNLNELEALYNDTGKTEDKALFAEQLGTCYGVIQEKEKAATWYQHAGEHYEELDDKDRSATLKQAAEANRASANLPQIIEPENADMDENIGQY